MSNWIDHGIRTIVLGILETVEGHDKNPDRVPFITPYQLAIIFQRDYPNEFAKLALPVGGKDTGQNTSLAQYIARQLAKESQAENPAVEMVFLYRKLVSEISYKCVGELVKSSLDETYDLSLFRLKKK